MTFDAEHVMADLLAVTCEQLVRIVGLTHTTAHGRELTQRMNLPTIGDLVVVGPILHPSSHDYWRRVGVLIAMSAQPDESYTLWHPTENQPTTTTWRNVHCVAVPVSTRGMQLDKPVDGLFLSGATAIPLSLWSLKQPKHWPGGVQHDNR